MDSPVNLVNRRRLLGGFLRDFSRQFRPRNVINFHQRDSLSPIRNVQSLYVFGIFITMYYTIEVIDALSRKFVQIPPFW